MLKVTPVLLTPQLDKIKAALHAKQVKRAKKAGQQFIKIATRLLAQTFEHWNESGENKYQKPTVRGRVKVEGSANSGKVEMTVHILVIDPTTNGAHFLWHILSQGRDAYVFPIEKRSPVLKKRKRRRTSADTLKVDPFPGFTGEKFVIHGGTTVRAVPGNYWYKAAAEQLIEEAKSDALLKSFLPKFVIEPMTRGT